MIFALMDIWWCVFCLKLVDMGSMVLLYLFGYDFLVKDVAMLMNSVSRICRMSFFLVPKLWLVYGNPA